MNKEDIPSMTTCSNKAVTDAIKKQDREKLKVSQEQNSKIQEAVRTYKGCIQSAAAETTSSTINTTEIDAVLDKFKTAAGKCLSDFSNAAKTALECE